MAICKKLKASTVPITLVTDDLADKMFKIFETYYEKTNHEHFIRDLRSKDKVILLKDTAGDIRGFSTIVEFNLIINGREQHIVYSGDTIIVSDFRGTSALTMEFLKNILKAKIKNLNKPVWWLLVSKGYKTYLLLANNFIEYFPRYDKETTVGVKSILKDSTDILFPGCYCEDTGIVGTENNEHEVLKSTVAPISEELIEKYPRIKFFNDINPNWGQGEELACIGRVDLMLGIVHPLKILKKIFLKKKSNKNNK